MPEILTTEYKARYGVHEVYLGRVSYFTGNAFEDITPELVFKDTVTLEGGDGTFIDVTVELVAFRLLDKGHFRALFCVGSSASGYKYYDTDFPIFGFEGEYLEDFVLEPVKDELPESYFDSKVREYLRGDNLRKKKRLKQLGLLE